MLAWRPVAWTDCPSAGAIFFQPVLTPGVKKWAGMSPPILASVQILEPYQMRMRCSGGR